MKRILVMLAGVVVFFIGVWGGAFLLTIFPTGSTYGAPAFVTAFVVVLLGGWLFGFGLIEMRNNQVKGE